MNRIAFKLNEHACGSDHLFGGPDMTPKLCGYAGVFPMPGSNGKSIRALIRRRKTEWRNRLATTPPLLRHRMILKGDYKLIYTRKGGTALERWR